MLELRTFPDTGRTNEVKALFHFFFQLILARKKDRERLSEFGWNYNADPIQRLYLSKDTGLLMEVINNKVAIVYSRKDEDVRERQGHRIWGNSKANGKLVRWEVLYRIRSIPSKLVGAGV